MVCPMAVTSDRRELILASTSRYRRDLLARLGVPFEAIAPDVDEDAFKDRGLSPRELAETLANAKAAEVASRFPLAVVIGSDQVAVIDDQAIGKPGSRDRAREQLGMMSGRAHQLITAIAVVSPDRVVSHTDVTTLVMRTLSDEAIRRYVEADDPLDCAGSYKLESRGITLFKSIASEDHTAIIGMPLIALTSLLRGLDFEIP